MAIPHSTYRIQVRPSFDLYAAADACDYLATVGVGAVYASPLLPSARGSEHGYDVVRFDSVDPARGGLDGWTRFLAAARARGLRIVVDIVPNHAGVATPSENPAWWDVLRYGRDSKYADWFDIDWTRGRLLLPILGDAFAPSELHVVDGELRYYEHRFPLAPGTEAAPGESVADVHDRQHYELASWRRGDAEHNYRRFFAISALAGLRVEDPAVFDATHEQITRWLQADGIDGLRIDHPDGLADPGGYFTRLRSLAGDGAWLVVEKILEPGEQLPDEWPVDGTTGYDAAAEVCGLFIDPTAEPDFDALYRELTGDYADFATHVSRGKRGAVTTMLRAEVTRMARLVPGIDRAEEALAELLVAFPVYRSYLPFGAEHLATAIRTVQQARPDLADSVGAVAARLADPADELCVRFQQTSGAVMAKGVEDTGYYRYNRFVALNEVGADPSRFGLPPADFHAAQQLRQRRAPCGMTTLSTHDTKRSEDVRARLAALSELPEDWATVVRRVSKTAPVPDPSFGYLLWQTFIGAGFIARRRMHAYVEKAMREAAIGTTWVDPNPEFEDAVHAAVDAAYDVPAVHDPLAALGGRVEAPGWSNSLSQKLVQLTMPGVPDVYQGTELWDDSLVDPDNRRAVDFGLRRDLLARLDKADAPPRIDGTGAAKLWVVTRTLRLRRDWPDLFESYDAVPVAGAAAEHAVVFDRGGAVTVATRLPVRLAREGGWRDTHLDVGSGATDILCGRRFAGTVALADLLRDYPVALLVR